MIIKIIPETAEEKARIKKAEHYNVRDFFVIGNKAEEGDLIDFHDYHGSNRYLIGTLYYFLEEIKGELGNLKKRNRPEIEKEITLQPSNDVIKFPLRSDDAGKMIKRGDVSSPNLEIVEVAKKDEEVVEEVKDNDAPSLTLD